MPTAKPTNTITVAHMGHSAPAWVAWCNDFPHVEATGRNADEAIRELLNVIAKGGINFDSTIVRMVVEPKAEPAKPAPATAPHDEPKPAPAK